MSDYFPANQSVASTRWLTEEVFKLIELVQKDEAIYNPRHKYYFCRPYVENFWREVDQKLDKNPGASLAKWTNLRISFRREFTNYLEEQVPPCWSYFDRMFFLHPYLRKKQQQQPLRPGDPNLQETLAQISELSNRLEHRVAKETIKSTSSTDSIQQQTTKDSLEETSNTSRQHPGPIEADHYFDYYDETEPNNSELDDDEQHVELSASRYPHIILETTTAQNEIKSECEDEVQEDDYDRFLESRHPDDHDIDRVGETTLTQRNTIGTPSSTQRLGKRGSQQQMRLEHLNRLQTRIYHEDLRAKRSRSPDRSVGNTQANVTSISGANSSLRLLCTSAHSSTNVSFVRPTIASNVNIGSEVPNSTATTVANQSAQQQTRPNFIHAQHNLRVDSAGTTNLPSAPSNSTSLNVGGNVANNQLISPTLPTAAPTHLELCDCKTDPDAMFLMSLLPDIQKLNGRDRGKIKIAFQNILQDYLYPD